MLVSSRPVTPAGSFVGTELAKDAGLSPLTTLAQNVEGGVGVDHRLATQAGNCDAARRRMTDAASQRPAMSSSSISN